MNNCRHAPLGVNADVFCDDHLPSTSPSPGDKITLDPEFEAWANLAEGVLFTAAAGTTERRAALEFVDQVIDASGPRLSVFHPDAWREAFRRAGRAGARVVIRRQGHARARRPATARRRAGSGGGDDSGSGSGDPDPDGVTWQDLVDDFADARDEYVAFGPIEAHQIEALKDAVSALAAYGGWDLSLDARVAAADCLREDAEEFGDDLLLELADVLAPAADFPKRMNALSEAWRAYLPHAALSGSQPTAEAQAALRRATAEARDATPRCPSELGRKAKAAAIVGIYAKVRRSCPRPDPFAVALCEHFLRQVKPLPAWFFARMLGFPYVECGQRREAFVAASSVLDELIEAAGPTWMAAIAADVERLRDCGVFPRRRGTHRELA